MVLGEEEGERWWRRESAEKGEGGETTLANRENKEHRYDPEDEIETWGRGIKIARGVEGMVGGRRGGGSLRWGWWSPEPPPDGSRWHTCVSAPCRVCHPVIALQRHFGWRLCCNCFSCQSGPASDLFVTFVKEENKEWKKKGQPKLAIVNTPRVLQWKGPYGIAWPFHNDDTNEDCNDISTDKGK